MKNPIHKEMIEIFHTYYLREKGIKFIWDAKHNKQIDVIYQKLFATCKESNDNVDDGTILLLFNKMLVNLEKADKWIYENVSPALISSKFNELVSKIRKIGNENYQDKKVDLIKKMLG